MLTKFFSLMLAAVLAAGCGVKAQTYVMTKERVDQNVSGNAGCLMGDCPAAPAPQKSTRKLYVLEVTKALPQDEVKKIEEETFSSITMQETEVSPAGPGNRGTFFAGKSRAIVIPLIEDVPFDEPAADEPAQGPAQDEAYTVLKDDTLQKIAKKFYGTYSRWYKIYEANKEKIKDPNLLKPGIELIIPAVK